MIPICSLFETSMAIRHLIQSTWTPPKTLTFRSDMRFTGISGIGGRDVEAALFLGYRGLLEGDIGQGQSAKAFALKFSVFPFRQILLRLC